MLGKNLPLSYFIQDPKISDSPLFGIPALGTIGSIHIDTLLLSVLSMSIILGAAIILRPFLTSESAGNKGQSFAEMIYEFLDDVVKGQIHGSTYKYFFPLIAAIFLFVLIANFIGVGPWKAFEFWSAWPHLGEGEAFEIASPTTDFNVTMALAAIAILTYLGSGFWAHGIKYIKAYLNPIEWLDLIIRPSTLALRLMMVITADELMRAAAITMAPALLPAGVMGFELFIGVIQAFVFALLTAIYIGLTVAHH